MRKSVVLSVGLCIVLAMTSCKSSESAYKKAYEKAKQQELAGQSTGDTAPVGAEVTPVVRTPVVAETSEPKVVESVPAEVREEKVTVVTGNADAGLKAYSVVCGSFGIKANADNLKSFLDSEGYHALVVFNAEKAMYRVVVSTFDDKPSAAQARDEFKAKYPARSDFQGAWLLYRIH